MAQARVTTSHTYNEGDAMDIARQIYDEFAALLQQLDVRLNEERLRADMDIMF